MQQYVLEMRGITKYIFDASGRPIRGTDVKILKNVDFNLKPGEVHVLLGENGAGKSTLMKVLGGIIPCDEGEMFLNGERIVLRGPQDSRAHGIAFIHQELNLLTNLSVAKNMFLGREIRRKNGLLDHAAMEREAEIVLRSLGFDIDPRTIVGKLSTAQQQIVEIAKALSYKSNIIIMDEPTASLTSKEIEALFGLIDDMRARGMSIIYISHRMEEIQRVADRVTILRDGERIGSMGIADFTVDKAILMMAGRTLDKMYYCEHVPTDTVALEVRGMRIGRDTEPIDIKVHAGEIVGLGGLVGAGRTELAKSIFGARKHYGGDVYLNGRLLSRRNPYRCVQHDLVYLSEDRKTEGLTVRASIQNNLLSAAMLKMFRHLWVSRRRENAEAKQLIQIFNIICNDREQPANTLSGGNQQRVCFAKWYATRPRVLILDEPTRGIDVGAKAQIYRIMDQAAQEGMAILMISSEMPELLGMSDRIYIMRDGRVTVEISDKAQMTQENVLKYTIGIPEDRREA